SDAEGATRGALSPVRSSRPSRPSVRGPRPHSMLLLIHESQICQRVGAEDGGSCMKVLVTGGTGFIGRHLVRRLLARGDDVTVLSREPSKATKQLPATRVLAWDPLSGPPAPS